MTKYMYLATLLQKSRASLILVLIGDRVGRILGRVHGRARCDVVPPLEVEDVADVAVGRQLGGRVDEPREESHDVRVIGLALILTFGGAVWKMGICFLYSK